MLKAKAYYNEYKMLVPHHQLGYVRELLENLYGGTDPFPSGSVDSIYFDTLGEDFYNQCFNGNGQKTKFRIRGYGGAFNQLHLKAKDIYSVAKSKAYIQDLQLKSFEWPDLQNLKPKLSSESTFRKIMAIANSHGPLYPAIRVSYHRQRFRIFDIRITLDSNIRVQGFNNGRDVFFQSAILPFHVLEIKTADIRPHQPLLGLLRLNQVSFSKYYMGLNLLKYGSIEPGNMLWA